MTMHHANNQRRDRGKFAPEYKSDMSSSTGDLMASMPVDDTDDDWGCEQSESVTPEPTTSVPGWAWSNEADDFVRSDDHNITSGQARLNYFSSPDRPKITTHDVGRVMAQLDQEIPRNPHANSHRGDNPDLQPERQYENLDVQLEPDAAGSRPARDPYAPAAGFGQRPAQTRDSGLPQPKRQYENFDVPLGPTNNSTKRGARRFFG